MSAKQWGHGFHSGRDQIITDIIKSLNMEILDNDYMIAVHLRQIGGKYCYFMCPICSNRDQFFKVTANTGWCDRCGTILKNFDEKHRITPDKNMNFFDFIGFVEIEEA